MFLLMCSFSLFAGWTKVQENGIESQNITVKTSKNANTNVTIKISDNDDFGCYVLLTFEKGFSYKESTNSPYSYSLGIEKVGPKTVQIKTSDGLKKDLEKYCIIDEYKVCILGKDAETIVKYLEFDNITISFSSPSHEILIPKL